MIKRMGADAIKMQTYTPDTMTIDCDAPDFQIQGGLWEGYKLYDLYQEAQTPFSWHKELFQTARDLDITLFSTPFDETAVDLLEDLNVPAYKIASFEITDIPLVKYVAATGKPMIISTGMANMEEIQETVETVRSCGNNKVILLHCISGYPAPTEQSNLATIPFLEKDFNCVVGLSDHTLGTAVSVASIALGACVIEKHVTLSRNDKGPDSEFSLEPDELKQLCLDTKEAYLAIGTPSYERKPIEESSLKFRRSLYFVKDLEQGETITENHIRRIRPGYGIPPRHYDEIIGKTVNQPITRGTAVNWSLLNDTNP
tara:strand:- start:1526 stop:2467 length:942 start_codon:yes stop_codon:yes gene_type:complete